MIDFTFLSIPFFITNLALLTHILFELWWPTRPKQITHVHAVQKAYL